MSTAILPHKLETEEIELEVDMLSRVTGTEYIATCAVSIEVLVGDDPNAYLMVSTVPTVANNVVTQKVTGGVAGVIYKIYCSGRSNENNIYVNELKLAVLSDNATAPAALV